MSVADIEIRDRRELPFFMVRVEALRAIRSQLHGLRRARALGAYITLCAEANRQRAAGDHARLYLTQPELADRLGAGRSSLREHLTALAHAGVVAQRRRFTEDGQPLPTEITLPIQSAAFVAISVASLVRLEAAVERRGRLGTLGLYGVLIELCNEQRAAHGGGRAVASRRALAERLGVTVRSLDGYARELAAADLLEITRRPLDNRSHLPNLWELREPQIEPVNGRAQKPALPDAEPGPTPCNSRSSPAQEPSLARAEPDLSPGASCSPVLPESRTAFPRTEDGQEEHQEHPSPMAPDSPLRAAPTAGTGASAANSEVLGQLCERLADSVAERTTPRSRTRPGGWHADREGWLAAAAAILADGYEPQRVAAAIDALADDWFLGAKLLTMPALAARIDEVVIRAETRNRVRSASTDDGFEAAWLTIERAIRRHGADRKALALEDLDAQNPRLARFAERIGWRELCRQPIAMHRRSWQQAWRDVAAPDDQEIA